MSAANAAKDLIWLMDHDPDGWVVAGSLYVHRESRLMLILSSTSARVLVALPLDDDHWTSGDYLAEFGFFSTWLLCRAARRLDQRVVSNRIKRYIERAVDARLLESATEN